MLASPIESLLLALGAKIITDVILILLFGVFFIAIYLKKKNKSPSFTNHAPTLLTTLGILGTFAGIIAGLLAFDINSIDLSISGLLDGLKTAFITSLVGMSLSILYKIAQNSGWISAPLSDGVSEDEIGVVELYAVMQQQAKGINDLSKIIGGDENDSLVSQLKLFRSDANDQHKKMHETTNTLANSLGEIQQVTKLQQSNFNEFEERLWLKLQDFADMMSKSATEQVISALKEVITDFNNNLTEQFGENFKQLNAAVLKLVEWQENYKQQLLQMTDQYAQGVIAITETEKSVSQISNETKAIPQTMQELQQIIQVNQHQINELEQHLSTFSDIRDHAVAALPEIRTHIDTAVDGMKSASESMTQGITSSTDIMQKAITQGAEELIQSSNKVNTLLAEQSLIITDTSKNIHSTLTEATTETNTILRTMVTGMNEESKNLHQAFREAGTSAINEAKQIRLDFEAGIETMRSNLAKSINDLAEQQQNTSKQVLSGMSTIADEALSNTSKSVEKQIHALDEALQHELQQVMTEMGKALTAISGRFTGDYQKLTEQMHHITQMAATGR